MDKIKKTLERLDPEAFNQIFPKESKMAYGQFEALYRVRHGLPVDKPIKSKPIMKLSPNTIEKNFILFMERLEEIQEFIKN